MIAWDDYGDNFSYGFDDDILVVVIKPFMVWSSFTVYPPFNIVLEKGYESNITNLSFRTIGRAKEAVEAWYKEEKD